MYCRMNVPGLRSRVAKSPAWPAAGCVDPGGRGTILTRELGPLGVFGGMSSASMVRVWRVARCVEGSSGE